jgi:hypothetical protein
LTTLLTGTCAQERNDEIKLALKQFLPEVQHTDENFAQVRWHFAKDGCKEQFFRPMSDLMKGKVVPDSEDTIHLHEPKTDSADQQKHPVLARSQNLGGGAETGSDENNDDKNNDKNNDTNNSESNDTSNDGDEDDDKQKQGEGQSGASKAADDENSNDSQTDDMDEDLDDDHLYIKIIYDLKGVPDISKKYCNAEELPTEALSFPRHLSLPEVYDELAEIVERRLKKQARECYDRLTKGGSGWSLLLAPTLEHGCPIKQRAFSFDDRGISRVARVNDLLRDMEDPETHAYERDTHPQLTIKLSLINVIKRAEDTHPFILIRPGAVAEKSGGMACVYRIGAHVRPPGSQKHAVKVSDVWFWCCDHGEDATGVRLLEAHSWSLRDLEICSPAEGRICGDNIVRLGQAEIEGPATPAQFREQLKSSKLQPYVEGSLLYDFRHWALDIAPEFDVSPVTVFPGRKISVAVRYVSHLTGREAEALKFPLGKEISCDEDDDCADICAAFMRILEKENVKSALFHRTFKSSWRLEVWIMPQIPEGRTLFRFEGEAKLMHWLHEPYVATGDTALLAEVYLCPVVQKEATTKSGRKVTKKGPVLE